MAYVNETYNNGQFAGRHGVFESSLLKATTVGRLWDVRVTDGQETPANIAVDNGVPVVIGEYTHNGLQEVVGTVAGLTDAIAVVGTDPVVKDARIRREESPEYFYNKAGKLARVYEVLPKVDIFAVGLHQFTNPATVAEDVFVTVSDPESNVGMWTASTTEPDADDYGFIGKVHSIQTPVLGDISIVRIQCLKNEAVVVAEGGGEGGGGEDNGEDKGAL